MDAVVQKLIDDIFVEVEDLMFNIKVLLETRRFF